VQLFCGPYLEIQPYALCQNYFCPTFINATARKFCDRRRTRTLNAECGRLDNLPRFDLHSVF
jgi:hypothetical protein